MHCHISNAQHPMWLATTIWTVQDRTFPSLQEILWEHLAERILPGAP
jgi:hypothetical protein